MYSTTRNRRTTRCAATVPVCLSKGSRTRWSLVARQEMYLLFRTLRLAAVTAL